MKFLSIFLIGILAVSLVGLFNFNYSFAAEVDDRLTIKSSKKMASFGEEVVFSGKLVNRNGDPVSSAEIFLWRTDGIKVEIVRGGITKTNVFGEYSISTIIKNWDYDINNLKYYTVSSLINAKSIKILITIGESTKSYQNISTAIVPKVRDVTQQRSSSQINPTSNAVKTTDDDLYKESAYKVKQSYYEALTLLESGIKLSESTLSDVVLEDSEAKKQIDAAVKFRVIASNSIAIAKSSLYDVESYLKDYEYQKAWNKLQEIDNHISSAKNNISGITKEIIDAQKLEDDYQEKIKFCFLFWCYVKAQNEDLDLKIKDIELIIEKIYTKEQKTYSEQQRLVQKLQLAKQERDSIAELERQEQNNQQELANQALLQKKELEKQERIKQQELAYQEQLQKEELDRQERIKQQELAYQEQLQKEELDRQERIKQQELAYKQQQIEWEEKNRILQLAVTNPRIAGIIDGTLRFYIDPIPYYAAPGTQKAVDEVADAFETHYLSGAKVERVYSGENANIVVQWVRDFGKSTLGHAVFKSYVEVELGRNNCNGDWMPYNPTSIKKVLWHEIGHSVGYDHSNDPTNVMYYATSPQFATEQKISMIINDGYWQAWEICGSGPYYYSFSTSRTTDGFDIYVIPPETKPETFLKNSNALRYTDCGMKNRQSYNDTCNVKSGSYVFIYNYENHPIRLTGEITYIGDTSWPNMTWDKEGYQYNEAELKEIWNLFH